MFMLNRYIFTLLVVVNVPLLLCVLWDVVTLVPQFIIELSFSSTSLLAAVKDCLLGDLDPMAFSCWGYDAGDVLGVSEAMGLQLWRTLKPGELLIDPSRKLQQGYAFKLPDIERLVGGPKPDPKRKTHGIAMGYAIGRAHVWERFHWSSLKIVDPAIV